MYKHTAERYFGPEVPCAAIRAIGYSRQKQTRPGLEPHSHPYIELSIIQHGQVNWFANDLDMTLPAGAGLLTFPGDLHGCKQGVFEPCQLAWLQIEPQQLPDKHLASRLEKNICRPIYGLGPLGEDHAALMAECRRPRPDSPEIMQTLLELLLRRCARIAEHEQPADQMPPPLQRALQALIDQPKQQWEVKQLAAIAGIGRSRLHQLFTHYLGQSPATYALHQRLHLTQEHLRESNASITAIALEFSFSSSQHFATAFKKRYGITPRAYRCSALYS